MAFFLKLRQLTKLYLDRAILFQTINNNPICHGRGNGFSCISYRSNCQLVSHHTRRRILHDAQISSTWLSVRFKSVNEPASLSDFQNDIYDSSDSKQFTLAYFEDLEKKVLEENHPRSHLFSNSVMIKLYISKMLDAGICFMEYLTQKEYEIPLVTRVYYIALLGLTNIDHKHDDLIYSEYEKCGEISSKLIYSYVIEGYASTRQWKKSLDLLKLAESSDELPYRVYEPVLKATLENGDLQSFEPIFHVVCKIFVHSEYWSVNFRIRIQEIFHKFIDACERRERDFTIYKLLYSLQHYDLWPDQRVAERMKQHFEHVYKYKVRWSLANSWGQCDNCSMKLNDVELTEEEFEGLKNSFLDCTLNKGDNYYWTTPEEMNRFKEFLDFHQFDVVLDCLNIGCATRVQGISKKKFIQRVINKFVNRNKKVLVISRKHYVKDFWDAETFLVENTSKDDFFVLFAALHSGPSCMFVTRDYLRDSKYQLGVKTGVIFQKWQRSRQIMIRKATKNTHISLDWPSNYDARPQKVENGWHIPFLASQEEIVAYKVPRTILCVQYNKN